MAELALVDGWSEFSRARLCAVCVSSLGAMQRLNALTGTTSPLPVNSTATYWDGSTGTCHNMVVGVRMGVYYNWVDLGDTGMGSISAVSAGWHARCHARAGGCGAGAPAQGNDQGARRGGGCGSLVTFGTSRRGRASCHVSMGAPVYRRGRRLASLDVCGTAAAPTPACRRWWLC